MERLFLMVALLAGSAFALECMPGNTCWPSSTAISTFGSSLTGRVVLRTGEDFKKLTTMKNTLETRSPGMVVLPKNTKDVQKAILFAKQHNIRVTLLSSGSSYIGRSTAAGSMMIHFGDMKDIQTDTSASVPSMTVEPGTTFKHMYKEADKVGYIISGSGGPAVSPAGCTLGGCHGPMSRMLGLSADNVLAFTVVTANGSIANMTASTGVMEDKDGNVQTFDAGDLFWALRGGGGAFAAVTSITFKMHKPPSGFVQIVCAWQWGVAKDLLNYYNGVIQAMPKQWGGYAITGNAAYIKSVTANPFATGAVTISLLHFGPWGDFTTLSVIPLTLYRQDKMYYCTAMNYTTFWDYTQNITTTEDFRADVYSRLLAKEHLVSGLTNTFVDYLTKVDTYGLPMTCTTVLLGGEVSKVATTATAVGEDLRESLALLTCAAGWGNDYAKDDKGNLWLMMVFGQQLQKYGRGAYYNEPGRSMPKFSTEFFKGNYARLLKTKKEWDPQDVFRCAMCVGAADMNTATGRKPDLVAMSAIMLTLVTVIMY